MFPGSIRTSLLAVGAVAALALAGCNATAPKNDDAANASTPAPAPAKSAKTAKASNDRDSGRTGNERKVKGRDGWEGTITGTPFKGSKFSRLEIGMSYKQVLDLIGQPTDRYSHVTGKAWIPFYYGSGRYEHKLLYKGQGRLAFAGDAGFSSNAHLIAIEYNSSESGYN